MSNDDTCNIYYDELVKETGMAVLLDFDDIKVWLPKSQIAYDEDEKWVELPEWLAIEKGLV